VLFNIDDELTISFWFDQTSIRLLPRLFQAVRTRSNVRRFSDRHFQKLKEGKRQEKEEAKKLFARYV
jgi:hypothetical protein